LEVGAVEAYLSWCFVEAFEMLFPSCEDYVGSRLSHLLPTANKGKTSFRMADASK